ncbi:hypothetical protein BSKO_04004 [Bryopsis sp. KO-2023]|nr:hypothetical protein BSKO_04004 [Bryopsis sp. KO-2023]
MELELRRNDLLQTGPCARGTMVVLPPGSNKQQKIAVGDLSGTVQCFSIKKGEVAVSFKTLPSRNNVTTVILGKGKQQRDKIFVMEGHVLRGFNKKGREFFSFDTNLTEKVAGLAIHETDMWVSGEYVHNHFHEAKEKHFYIAPDRINHSDVIPVTYKREFNPVLACEDRIIRVLTGSEVSSQIAVEAAPTCVKYVLDSHDPHSRHPDGKEVLYGTENGIVGQLFIEPDSVISRGFEIRNPKKLGAVTAIYSGIDFTKDGVNDIVVGRDDGNLEIYNLDEQGEVQQVFSTHLPESINSIGGGYITSPNVQDLVVQTFSGKVVAYCLPGAGLFQPANAMFSAKKQSAADADEEARKVFELKIRDMGDEVKILTAQLEDIRHRHSIASKNQEHIVNTVDITVRSRLDAEDGSCVVTIEAGTSIFAVALQCNIPLELLETETNIAIRSITETGPKDPNQLLATYRCQDNTSRVEIRFKAKEGKAGELQMLILPNVVPRICQTKVHKIKPLCLHRKLPAEPTDLSSRPMGEVTLSGDFTLAEVHSWLGECLPDSPSRLTEEQVTVWYENTISRSVLMCQYRAKETKFRSDSVSALAILREFITLEATKHNQRISMGFNPHLESMEYNLQLLWPKLEFFRSLERQVSLIDALQELKLQDDDVSYLSDDLLSTLAKADQIKEEFKRQPQQLQNMMEWLRNLMIDWNRLNGMNMQKQQLNELQRIAQQPTSEFKDVLNVMLGKY